MHSLLDVRMEKLILSIAKVGSPFTQIILSFGRAFILLILILKNLFYLTKKIPLLIKELHYCGVKSIIIITTSGWFVGMVLALQAYNTLNRFGSVSMLGSVVALSLLRELGPVLSAILFAARAGSGITAEIGLMRATEQIDAMEVMGINPIKRVLSPKFFAAIIAVPLLAAIFNASGILGGYFVGVGLLHLDSGSFWSQMQNSVEFHNDIINGLLKSIIFGITISLIAIYQGYNTKPTAEGVANSTTKTVVHSALFVLALDFILTALMF